jgi:hypothetical protein
MRGRDAVSRRAAPAPSASLAIVVGARLWRSLPRLLGANAIFLAWCAPYGLLALLGLPALALAVVPLTVGPGLVSLMAAAARAARGEPGLAWAASLGSLRGFRTGAVLATALLLAWHAQLVAVRAMVEQGAATGTVGLWAAQVALLAFGGLVSVHALPLAGLYGQGPLEAARNGFVLAARHPGPTIATLGLAGAAGSVTWMLGGAPLVILPAALALTLVSSTQHMLDGEGAAP